MLKNIWDKAKGILLAVFFVTSAVLLLLFKTTKAKAQVDKELKDKALQENIRLEVMLKEMNRLSDLKIANEKEQEVIKTNADNSKKQLETAKDEELVNIANGIFPSKPL